MLGSLICCCYFHEIIWVRLLVWLPMEAELLALLEGLLSLATSCGFNFILFKADSDVVVDRISTEHGL